MKFAAVFFVAIALLLAGCSGPTGRGLRILPWNWFSPDHSTQLDTAQKTSDVAKNALVKKAQENVRGAGKTIALLPLGLLRQVLEEFNGRADAELADALGAIAPDTDRGLAQIVQQLTSENADLRTQGAAALSKRDKIEDELSTQLSESRNHEQQLTEKLKASDLDYQAQAEKHRRLMFWICLIVGGWLLLQILSGVARFYPGLAPVARLAGMVSAPAVQAAYDRMTTAGGRMLADAEKVGGDLAEQIRNHLDKHTDAADQAAVRAGYNTAPRT